MKLESHWLLSSHVVAKVQHFFGLELLEQSQDNIDKHNGQNGDQSSESSKAVRGGVNHRRQANEQVEMKPQIEQPRYCVKNWFWYYIFAFGAALGDDIFYYTAYTFWFFNLSPWVIRRVLLVWAPVMYVGQTSKEVLRWPRPSEPPVVRIEQRYMKEYGMPSTHAMVGTLVPFTILAVTWDQYEYSHTVGILLASFYALLVCVSRLYRGMHYILDILVGASVCFVLMGIILQFIDALDFFLLTHPYAPVILISTTTLFLVIYPCKDWSSTRKDTTVLMASFSGLMTGSWISNQLGYLVDVDAPVKNPLVWPGWTSIALMLLREFAGLGMIVVVYFIVRALVLRLMSIIMWRKIDRTVERTLAVELPFTFVSNFCIALAMVVVAPITFKTLGIPVYTFNV